MSTDDKEKQAAKEHRKLLVTLATAGFAAVTAVGDGVRSYFERQDDIAKAVQADQARVDTDKSIQVTVTKALEDLHEKHDTDYDALRDLIEEQDRAIFELRVENELQERLLEQTGDLDEEFRAMLMIEALEAEAKKEDLVVHAKPKKVSSTTADSPPPEASVKAVAGKVAEKKKEETKKRKERPRPKFLFEEPAPVYQLQQQIQQQLPPRPFGKKK